MNPQLTWETVEATAAERLSEADSKGWAAGQVPARAEPLPDTATVTVRFASPQDARALERLAALDSRPVPAGEALVAELDGELAAALSLADRRALADPFRPTAELVGLLELRADQLLEPERGRRRLPRLRRVGHRRAAAVRP
jgi:hypothetical protein